MRHGGRGEGRGNVCKFRNFSNFQGLGDFENSLCPVKKKLAFFFFFREIKIAVGNISNKFYFYSRSLPNGGGIKWRNWFGLNLFHRKLANDLNCATHLHGP